VVTLAPAVLWASAGNAARTAPAQAASARVSTVVRLGTASDVLILPPHPRALAVTLHGGIALDPARAAVATRVSAQVYAGRLAPLGIGVLSVDYRWSGYGGGELQDVQAALAFARRDPATAGLPTILMGASHGGYLAALAATTPTARATNLRAVVDLYGFSDLGATISSPSSRYDRQALLTLRELGPPAGNASAYAARSPLARAALLSAPLFQAVGSADRATRPDVVALTRAIRSHGGAPVLYVIPGLGHGLAFGSASSPRLWGAVSHFLDNSLRTR
jgi:dipeptidyl aminopeptidase/acylaminoacyl peptidase